MLRKYYLVKVFIKMTYRPDSYELERYQYDMEPSNETMELLLKDLKHWEKREGYEGKIYAEVTQIYTLIDA